MDYLSKLYGKRLPEELSELKSKDINSYNKLANLLAKEETVAEKLMSKNEDLWFIIDLAPNPYESDDINDLVDYVSYMLDHATTFNLIKLKDIYVQIQRILKGVK